MTFSLGMPLLVECALFALAVIVLMAGIIRPTPRGYAADDQDRTPAGTTVGWVTLCGLLAIFGLTFLATDGASILSGSFVQDGLAIFAKQLFIASAALSVLGSLTLRHDAFTRRTSEYHFALVASFLWIAATCDSIKSPIDHHKLGRAFVFRRTRACTPLHHHLSKLISLLRLLDLSVS